MQYLYLSIYEPKKYDLILLEFKKILDEHDNCFLRDPDKTLKDLFHNRLCSDLDKEYGNKNNQIIGYGYDIGYCINHWYKNSQIKSNSEPIQIVKDKERRFLEGLSTIGWI